MQAEGMHVPSILLHKCGFSTLQNSAASSLCQDCYAEHEMEIAEVCHCCTDLHPCCTRLELYRKSFSFETKVTLVHALDFVVYSKSEILAFLFGLDK
jgi:hypothetical protein